jgi:glycosyltransferase involved in cell wall biosynthesis
VAAVDAAAGSPGGRAPSHRWPKPGELPMSSNGAVRIRPASRPTLGEGAGVRPSAEASSHATFHAPGPQPSLAVLLPCRNEEVTIGKTVRDFRRALPTATIYVYDNASSDRTAPVARSAGAIVRRAPIPGKGNVLRRMFAEVDADVYVLADGDGTYDPTAAPDFVSRLCHDHLDMVVGRRVVEADTTSAYRPGHQLGNRLLTGAARWVFGNGPRDMLSGYRVFSRRYVKSFPAASRGFEVETEMTIHALELNLPFDEVPTRYGERPGGSRSKLRTIPDGLKILKFITVLCKDYKPLRFFGSLGLLAALLAFSFSRLTEANVAASSSIAIVTAICGALAMIFVLAGLVLDSLGRSRREMKRMLYLAVSPTAEGGSATSFAVGDAHGVA